MSLLRARSVAEEHLYMEVRPCVCGDATWSNLGHALQQLPAGLASVFTGKCASCGAPREFSFEVPERPTWPDGGYGGPEPSSLLDAGEWLAISDAAARVPAQPPTNPDARTRARQQLERATHSLEEVLKFIPAGAREVAAAHLTSAAAQRISAAEPGRFARARLEARLGAYRDLLGAYAAS